MKIELYSTVRLKDGREGAVVDMAGPDYYLVDVGSSPEDWETISVHVSEIVEVLCKSTVLKHRAFFMPIFGNQHPPGAFFIPSAER